MKSALGFLFLLLSFHGNSFPQEIEESDSIHFSNRSHYDAESQEFVQKMFQKNRYYPHNRNKTRENPSLSNYSDNYIKIPLGREDISGWTIYSAEFNIWQVPLDLKLRMLLVDGNQTYGNSSFNYDLWIDSSWYWGNNILYFKNDDGNPDTVYESVVAINSGGWGTTTGDFNNDNFPDIVYSDYLRTYVHYGGPEFSIKADKELATQGFYVANAGDTDGDGYDELSVSLNWGRDTVYIYLGSSEGLNEDNKFFLLAPEGYNSFGFGHSISKNPGDINGDGLKDVLIGAGGYFCIYFGNFDGIKKQPDIIWEYPEAVPDNGILNLSFIGDINSDGYDDIAASYPSEAPTTLLRVYVFYGSPNGLNYNYYQILDFEGLSGDTHKTANVSKSGDINNDGFDDLLIGNQWYNKGTGQAFLFYGSSEGIANTPDQIIENPSAILNSRFGNDLDGIGDFNNDGFNDIIIGCPYETSYNGSAYIYYGSNLGISDSPNIILTEDIFFGWSVSRAGDVFGNGRNYIVVGEEFGESYLITLSDSMNYPPNWQINIYVSDADNINSKFITLGQNELATDNIDFLLGEEELPPSPPAGVFDIRLILPNSVNSLKDFRSIEESEISWTVKFLPSSAGYPITFNWNNTILPEGSFYLKDTITGSIVNVDMKAQNSFTLTNSAISLLYIEHSKQICTDISVNNNWNIISVPLEMSDMHTSKLFPNAVSSAFSYDNGYLSIENLEVGKGYWLKFNNSENIPFCGLPINKNIKVKAGWNIIGPLDLDVPVDKISSVPEGIITSDFFSYYNGYNSTNTLYNGKGYWVKVSQNGEILYEKSDSLQIIKEKTKNESMMAIPIYVSDAYNIDTLIVGIDPIATDSIDTNLGEAILPPLPPPGAFDTRLNIPNTQESSQKDFRFGPEANEFERAYQVQYQKGDGNKITLYWDLPEGLSLRIQDIVTGSLIDETYESGADSITITNPDVISKLTLTVTYPSDFVPVELITFNGMILNNAVSFEWKTATETNNKGFEIQRKLNSDWEQVGYIEGNGTTTSPKEYTYIDNYKYQSYKGTVTYRLKQIDFDGSFHYSTEIKLDIDFTPKEFTVYQNFPNPFNPSTTIKYALPFESSVEIIIYNAIGQEVEIINEGIKDAGYYDAIWQPQNLSSGVYFFSIIAKSTDGKHSFTQTKKMLMMK